MTDGKTELDKLVNRSQRIGADPALVLHGGGNTLTKLDEHDGRVMRIKGSGTDLARSMQRDSRAFASTSCGRCASATR